MAIGTRCWPGNPLALAIVQRGFAVQRRSHLHAHPRRFAQHAAKEPQVDLRGISGPQSNFHLHTGGMQAGKTLARHQGVGVGHGGYHALHPRRNQRITTRAGTPVVAAGLQRYIGGCALGSVPTRQGIAQRHAFGMGATSQLGMALANQLAGGRHQHTANGRVGGGQRAGTAGQCQGLHHPWAILSGFL